MEYPRDLREFLHDLHAILMGLPLMDNGRELQLPRQLHLGPEGPLLDIPGDVLIVVVQADLSNGHHLAVLPGQLPIPVQRSFIHLVRRVRVGANGGVNIAVFPGQNAGRLAGGQAAPRIHQKPDPAPRQSLQQRRPVLVKSPVIHMGMGVK